MGFGSEPKGDSAEVMRELRDLALGVDPAVLGLQPTKERAHVWGVLMETGYPEGIATLVALADGTTSLYLSGGGGILGGGGHAAVREAVEAFLQETEAHIAAFAPTASTPLPEIGRVRFYVRTFKGMLTGGATEEDLGYNRHSLSPVFHSGHAVVSALRGAKGPRPSP